MCGLKKYNPLIRKMMVFTVIFFVCLLSSFSAYSAVPVLKNINCSYLGDDKILRIEYNLAYPGSGDVNISFVASSDGGKNFDIIPISVSHDIGNVIPGNGKKIDWKIVNDYPTLNPETLMVRMLAGDADHNLIYISKGNTEMVLIPGGSFRMGSYDAPDGMPIYGDELPDHIVSVDGFYMDAHEVTNSQYAAFMSATGHTAPLYWNDSRYNDPDKPVVGVTWNDAVAYCNWIGKRLPTEAEWEMAARGGQIGREFPWGNLLDSDSLNYANYAAIGGPDVWEDTSPVCSFLPNDYGLFDMIANAYEWCSDYYDFFYYAVSETNNPKGPTDPPTERVTRVLRGGSCYDGFFPSYLRSATRYSYDPETIETKDAIIGFRCVMDVPK
ncbi:MAG: formylglycine-generating enzyme family protein [Candidatus Poribacteria bacterium]